MDPNPPLVPSHGNEKEGVHLEEYAHTSGVLEGGPGIAIGFGDKSDAQGGILRGAWIGHAGA